METRLARNRRKALGSNVTGKRETCWVISSLKSEPGSTAKTKASHPNGRQPISTNSAPTRVSFCLALEAISEFIWALLEKEIWPYKSEPPKMPTWPFLPCFLQSEEIPSLTQKAGDGLWFMVSTQGRDSAGWGPGQDVLTPSCTMLSPHCLLQNTSQDVGAVVCFRGHRGAPALPVKHAA